MKIKLQKMLMQSNFVAMLLSELFDRHEMNKCLYAASKKTDDVEGQVLNHSYNLKEKNNLICTCLPRQIISNIGRAF